MKRVRTITADNVNLIGFLYGVSNNIWNIIIPGVDGNIITNDFLDIIGEHFSENNETFLFAHHRGSFQIISNNSLDPNIKGKTIGSAFEMFDDCILDIDSWIDFALKNGAKKINLLGHSHGCNKLIYYLVNSKKFDSYINKTIFISPLDLYTRMSRRRELNDLYNEAERIIKDNKNYFLCCGFFYKSVESFYDMMKNKNLNNFPMMSDDNNNFNDFNLIKHKKYIIYGSLESRYSKNFDIKFPLLKGVDKFIIIDDATHIYQGKEKNLADSILEVVKEDL